MRQLWYSDGKRDYSIPTQGNNLPPLNTQIHFQIQNRIRGKKMVFERNLC